VQSAEASLVESLTRIQSRFSTEFSTVVLKTSCAIAALAAEKTKAAQKGRPKVNFSLLN